MITNNKDLLFESLQNGLTEILGVEFESKNELIIHGRTKPKGAKFPIQVWSINVTINTCIIKKIEQSKENERLLSLIF